MILPLPFLVGIMLLLVAEDWTEPLPGSGDILLALGTIPLAFVPAAAAILSLRAVLRAARSGRPVRDSVAVHGRLRSLLVPLSYGIMLELGGWAALAGDVAPHQGFLHGGILLAPLLLAEASLRVAERPLVRILAALGESPGPFLGVPRLRPVVFVTSLLVIYWVAMELCAQDRHLEVFFSYTALGQTVGLILFGLLLCVALPLLFRLIFPVDSRLPTHLASILRDTAARLGFSERQLLRMDTGHRMANAMMLGPLPWPRYLVLTDGILALLDPHSLRGVVAHEIGHARHNHPAILVAFFVGVPFALLSPLSDLEVFRELTWSSGIILLVGLGVFIMLLRWVSHRFEYEADLAATEVLGGAEPCIRALQEVGRILSLDLDRATLRHPSERQRVHCMLRWEKDLLFRKQFRQVGLRLRRAMLIVGGIALVLSIWGHSRIWQVERGLVRYLTGDFEGAILAIEAVDGSLEPSRATFMAELLAEVRAAEELLPGGGRWEQIHVRLADEAWERALQVLADEGPGAALPWAGLASFRPDPVRRALYLWCRAAETGDEDRERVLREHLAGIDLPERLRLAMERVNPHRASRGGR